MHKVTLVITKLTYITLAVYVHQSGFVKCNTWDYFWINHGYLNILWLFVRPSVCNKFSQSFYFYWLNESVEILMCRTWFVSLSLGMTIRTMPTLSFVQGDISLHAFFSEDRKSLWGTIKIIVSYINRFSQYIFFLSLRWFLDVPSVICTCLQDLTLIPNVPKYYSCVCCLASCQHCFKMASSGNAIFIFIVSL